MRAARLRPCGLRVVCGGQPSITAGGFGRQRRRSELYCTGLTDYWVCDARAVGSPTWSVEHAGVLRLCSPVYRGTHGARPTLGLGRCWMLQPRQRSLRYGFARRGRTQSTPSREFERFAARMSELAFGSGVIGHDRFGIDDWSVVVRRHREASVRWHGAGVDSEEDVLMASAILDCLIRSRACPCDERDVVGSSDPTRRVTSVSRV